MRNWHLIILVIAVAVWILSSLIRGAQEQLVRRQRPQIEPDQPPDRPRRTPTEIDRFLLEVQRRRRESGDRRGEPERRQEPAALDIPLAIPVEPLPAPTPPPVARRTTARPIERPAKRRPAEIDSVAAAEVLAMPPVAPVAPWEDVVAAAPAPPPPPPPAQPGAVPAGTAAPVAKQLRVLLRTRQTLATAVALREILDRPVSRRRRGLK